MTVKGVEKALSDPRNRAVASVTDDVEIKYLGQMQSLAKRPRRWNVSTTVQMGAHSVFEHTDGPMTVSTTVSGHYQTEKLPIKEAVNCIVEALRDEMGKSRNAKHAIYMVLTINRNNG